MQFLNKNILDKEIMRYIVGGTVITIINITLYTILVVFQMKIRWANLIALTIAKLLGFFINKYYVYQSKNNNIKSIGKEAGKYIVARGFTGIMDYFATVILIEFCNYPKFLTKYLITALVIILNYILGKYFIFKKDKPNKQMPLIP